MLTGTGTGPGGGGAVGCKDRCFIELTVSDEEEEDGWMGGLTLYIVEEDMMARSKERGRKDALLTRQSTHCADSLAQEKGNMTLLYRCCGSDLVPSRPLKPSSVYREVAVLADVTHRHNRRSVSHCHDPYSVFIVHALCPDTLP